MPRDLLLRGFIRYDEVGMGQNQFEAFYMAFHPANGELVIHEGNTGKVYMGGRRIYSFEGVGRPPRAGGDTHGAMTWSRDLVIFGGWVKAPPGLLVSADRTLATQDMREKYSHIHAIDANGRVEVLWLRKWDSNLQPNQWYGEVTDLIYDGHENAIYFSRADGHAELGLWRLDLSTGRAEWLVRNRTVYKVEVKDDKIFATVFNPAHLERSAVVIYDMVRGDWRAVEEFELALEPGSRISFRRDGGQVVQLQNRVISFYGGVMVVSDPYRDRHVAYPLLEVVGPEFARPAYVVGLRTQKVYPMGLPIVAANPSEGLTEPALRTTVGLVMRVDGVAPQVLFPSGFISGMATDGHSVYFGASYANHCPAYTFRSGDGGIFEVPVRDLMGGPWAPLRLWVYDGPYRANSSGLAGWFGGLPLKGFKEKKLRVYVDGEARLRIAEYDLLGRLYEDSVGLRPGWNAVDLGPYYDMVAFSLDRDVGKVVAEAVLEP